ncbi:MAG: DNA-binding protein [Planctomycetes bacterium]|nr:DNA-binding protein [Planctomycetota bacterium]
MKFQPIPTLLVGLVLGACSNPQSTLESAVPEPTVEAQATGDIPSSPAPGMRTQLTGQVVETMQSGGYTYALLDTGTEQLWAAGITPPMQVGATVVASNLTPMKGFTSGTLNRTFDLIYFAGAMQAQGEQTHTAPAAQEAAAPIQVQHAEGDQTIEQVFASRDQFVGQEISLTGKVTKFNADIMGKNWLHLQDGTGGPGSNDLTITTDQVVAVGDLVHVRGVLVADKDFGFGYKYELIVEDAQVTVD